MFVCLISQAVCWYRTKDNMDIARWLHFSRYLWRRQTGADEDVFVDDVNMSPKRKFDETVHRKLIKTGNLIALETSSFSNSRLFCILPDASASIVVIVAYVWPACREAQVISQRSFCFLCSVCRQLAAVSHLCDVTLSYLFRVCVAVSRNESIVW